MMQISFAALSAMLALSSALAALLSGAAVWGALRTTVKQLELTVHEMRSEIASLRTATSQLDRNVAVLLDRSDRSDTTA